MKSLFDSPELWRADPAQAFDSLLADPHRFQALARSQTQPTRKVLRAATVSVYRSIFNQWVAFLADSRKEFFTAAPIDVDAFLTRVGASRSARMRAVTLLERVYKHVEVTPNPVTQATFDIVAKSPKKLGSDQAMVVLDEADRSAFMQALPPADGNWKRRRDRAMQCLMIGAGLKVSEVVGLPKTSLGDMEPGGIPVIVTPAAAAGIERHRTILRKYAAQPVLDWLREREALKIPGNLMFPADKSGSRRLNKATVYRQVRATMERAGVQAERLGGRTLRNTFAVRELAEGKSIEHVRDMLGHREIRSTFAYQDACNRMASTSSD